jgi:hypothetical protein
VVGHATPANATRESEKPPEPEGPSDFSPGKLALEVLPVKSDVPEMLEQDLASAGRTHERLRPAVQLADPVGRLTRSDPASRSDRLPGWLGVRREYREIKARSANYGSGGRGGSTSFRRAGSRLRQGEADYDFPTDSSPGSPTPSNAVSGTSTIGEGSLALLTVSASARSRPVRDAIVRVVA